MRAAVSVLAFTLAICGMLIVIAYTASEAYLNLRNQETNLNNTLLLGTLAPEGWSASPMARSEVDERFLSPCLNVPLLDGASISGRGATSFARSGSTDASMQLLMIETSGSDARSVMDSVRRDTENDCQRGVTVGTVSEAQVTSLLDIGADEAVLIELTRNEAGEAISYTEAVVRDGEFISRISYRQDPSFAVEASEISALAGRVVAQIEDPPSQAELEAAGAAEQPTILDRASERIQTDLGGRLSLQDRTSPYVGVGIAGGLAVLFYLLGAKLSGRRDIKSPKTSAPSVSTSQPTLENYGSSQRRWVQPRQPVSEPAGELEHSGAWDDEAPEPEPDIVDLPPVIDFPQRSIDEKLKILKEARLREPRPEPIGPSSFMPAVDWTEEISKSEPARHQSHEPATPAEPVTRKVLLQKLRSQQPGSN